MLVIGQFAMALILVTGAGLFASGANNFFRRRAGWDSRPVAQGSFELTGRKYAEPTQVLAFHRRVLEKLRQLPGVEAVSLSYGLPCDGPAGPRPYLVEGREMPAKGQEPVATYNGVTDDYFTITGIRLLRGRTFNAADNASARRVVMINESMAAALFSDGTPLGRHLAVAGTDKPDWAEIIGVVADVRSLTIYRQPVAFQVYHPLAQEPWAFARFAVRVAGPAPESVVASLRTAISELDPDLPVRELMTADAMIEHWGFELVLLRNMLSTFALLGLGLAVLGIYGVIARSVVQRSGEIGIRMALGATLGDVISLIVRGGARLALIGAAVGMLGALGLTRFIASLMPALEPDNYTILAGATGILVMIAMAACYLPARKAAKVDPIAALRAE
jgi:predicted permease